MTEDQSSDGLNFRSM